MSALLVTGPVVRLHERLTVTCGMPGLTLATTKRGPIMKSGCGRDARNTWARPGAGVVTTAQRTAHSATQDLIMWPSSAKS